MSAQFSRKLVGETSNKYQQIILSFGIKNIVEKSCEFKTWKVFEVQTVKSHKSLISIILENNLSSNVPWNYFKWNFFQFTSFSTMLK